MRRAWRKVAERAANPSFAPEEISNVLIPALAQDWNDDVSTDLVRGVDHILGDQQDLFKEQTVSRLESLRPSTAGHGLGKLFLDCAIQLAAAGEAGAEAPIEAAASNALAVRAARGAHQVEEHYCRKSNAPRAQSVRARIEQSIGGASLKGLARQLLKRDPAPASRTPAKQQGLDDGVRL